MYVEVQKIRSETQNNFDGDLKQINILAIVS